MPDRAAREAIIERFITERRLKATRQRHLILETFFQLDGHFSVEQLWAKVRELDPRV